MTFRKKVFEPTNKQHYQTPLFRLDDPVPLDQQLRDVGSSPESCWRFKKRVQSRPSCVFSLLLVVVVVPLHNIYRIMGCSQSFTKQSSEKHVPSDTLTESSSYKGTSTTSVDKNKNNNNKKPTRPMVFAIMRNGHEVIRGGMKDIQTALDEHRVEEAMDIYLQLDKWMKLHFLMEEGRPGSAGDTTPMGMFRYVGRPILPKTPDDSKLLRPISLDSFPSDTYSSFWFSGCWTTSLTMWPPKLD